MRFLVNAKRGDSLRGRLLYDSEEYSFRYEVHDEADLQRRAGVEGATSLVIDTLQVEVGVETGPNLFVWGYFPSTSWREARLPTPEMRAGVVTVEPADELEAGVSIAIARDSRWTSESHPSMGLVRVSVADSGGESITQVADGVGIGIADRKIRSIWLNPTHL